MKKRDFVFVNATSALATLLWLAAQTKGINQTALVIGNNAYQGGARLINAAKDARLMYDTFGKMGAQSLVSVRQTHLKIAPGVVRRVHDEDHADVLVDHASANLLSFLSGSCPNCKNHAIKRM